jgi:hypothetical protein
MAFITEYRTALGPTQRSIQWIPGALSLWVKRPGREADHSPPSRAEVKECVELYFYSPNTPSWRAQLKKAKGKLYLYESCTWKQWDKTRLKAADITFMTCTAGYSLLDHRRNEGKISSYASFSKMYDH